MPTPNDGPNFLQGVTEQPDGSLKNDILTDDLGEETPPTQTPETPPAPTPEASETPTPEAPKVETPPETPPAPETEPKKEEDVVYNATEILAKKPEERTDEEKKALTDNPDVLSDEQKKQLADEEASAQKIETPKKEEAPAPDASKAVEKVQEEAQKINDVPDEKATELQKNIKLAQKFPLIDVKPPDPSKFYIKNDDGEDEFQMADYMKVYTQSLVMAIQNSLVAGPLSAVTFGILQQAIKDDTTEMARDSEATKQASEVLDKLYVEFPKLKTDKDAENDLDGLIQVAIRRRSEEAKAQNKTPDPMKYEDIQAIALRYFGKPTTPTPQKEDGAEKNHGGPQLSPGKGAPKDEVLSDIEGMRKVGSGLPF